MSVPEKVNIYEIRPFQPLDVYQVMCIHHDAMTATNAMFPLYSQVDVDAWSMLHRDPVRVIQRFREQKSLVAVCEGTVRGFGTFVLSREEKVALLRQLYVDPKVKSNGVGSILYQRFESLAKEAGIQKIKLESALFPPTVQFYLNRGFKDLGEAKIPFSDHALAVRLMEKDL